MATGGSADPTRATFIAILQQLNRAESIHEGRDHDQALALEDINHALRRFWAVDEHKVKVPLALGLLVRNGLVRIEVGGPAPARGRPTSGARYRITSQGKQFLVESMQKTDRIA